MPEKTRLLPPVPYARFALLATCAAVVLSGCSSYCSHESDPAVEDSSAETRVMEGAEPVTIDRGRSRACLLMHGFASSPADFGTLPQKLDAAGWDVYAPRFPGHGTSPADLAQVSGSEIRAFAEKQYSKLEARYKTLVVGGFSMGGTLATDLACSHESEALLLISPFYKLTYKPYYVLPPEWWHAILSPFISRIPAGKAVNRPEGREELTVYDEMPIPATTELFALRDEVMEKLDRSPPRCPVLLVYSENDEVASPRAMRRVFRALPGERKRHVQFSRSNHHLLSDWDRQEAVRAILDFLNNM